MIRLAAFERDLVLSLTRYLGHKKYAWIVGKKSFDYDSHCPKDVDFTCYYFRFVYTCE